MKTAYKLFMATEFGRVMTPIILMATLSGLVLYTVYGEELTVVRMLASMAIMTLTAFWMGLRIQHHTNLGE